MVKQTQNKKKDIADEFFLVCIADELFERVWPFCQVKSSTGIVARGSHHCKPPTRPEQDLSVECECKLEIEEDRRLKDIEKFGVAILRRSSNFISIL